MTRNDAWHEVWHGMSKTGESKAVETGSEQRRGGGAADEAYLKLVGERVRLERVRRGLSRKALAEESGVSERYLAELERGTGNASLLVLRQIATAMRTQVADLTSEEADRSIDLALAIDQLESLTEEQIAEARRTLAARFGRKADVAAGRIALIGFRGAGKTSVGQDIARALEAPFVELDRLIEQASGESLSNMLRRHGDTAYRKLERECLIDALEANAHGVIATGGGIVTADETFELLLSSCFVVWLKASPEQHVSRAIRKGDLRPIARNRRVLEELRLVIENRAPLYARAHATIDTTAKSPSEVVSAVLELVGKGASDSATARV